MCDNETEDQRTALAVARCATSLTCFVLGLPIVVTVCARRMFRTFLQRQYLYLLLSTQAHLLILAAGADRIYADYSVHDSACRVLGFLTQWASLTELFFTLSIILVLHGAIIRHHLLRQVVPAHLYALRARISKVDGPRIRYVLEALLVALGVFFPLAIDWLPFQRRAYGLSGAWCWIISLNGSENCTDVGFTYQMGLQYVPVFFVSATCAALTLFTNLVLCWAAYRHAGTRHHHNKRAKETTLLLLCIVVSYALVMPEIATRTLMHRSLSAANIPYFVFMLYAVGTPLGRLVLSFDLFVYLYAVGSTVGRAAVFRRWSRSLPCCRRKYNLLDVEEDERERVDSSDMPSY